MTRLRTGETLSLTITALSPQGDGIAYLEPRHPVYVARSCPEDTVQARVTETRQDFSRAVIDGVITPSAQRIVPPCTYYDACGGCQLQHLNDNAYQQFKMDRIATVLARIGSPHTPIQPMACVGRASRRRTELAVTVHKGEIRLGYVGSRSHQLVNVATCLVLRPVLNAVLPSLRALLAHMKKPSRIASLHLTETDSGIDMGLQLHAALEPSDIARLKEWAPTQPEIARLWHALPEHAPIALTPNAQATMMFSGVAVELPAAAFLQASPEGQAALQAEVVRQTEGYARVVDLYCGCGTFAIPLATAGHAVSAYEGASEMVTALHNAALKAQLDTRLTAATRDLYLDPLPSHLLSGFDAAVINPPRNGALPQVKTMASSDIQRVVMVSCNPASFERDAKHLLSHGFVLDTVLPVDQFYWSSHLELVGTFTRN